MFSRLSMQAFAPAEHFWLATLLRVVFETKDKFWRKCVCIMGRISFLEYAFQRGRNSIKCVAIKPLAMKAKRFF